jgi:ABC-type branched-subunit amino acid transport system substrate-binding protein/DNA-binding beta-propeller fold protein YncE
MVRSGVDSLHLGTRLEGALTPGTTFAGYRIDSPVGRGGMGVVYRATDRSLERPVALKLITPKLVGDDRFRERFLREPRLAASLDHPNVIPIYEAGERDGQLYLAMRFVNGSDLKTLLEREEKLSPERALNVLAQIAGALDAAHRRALVHRDVKPANVLIDEDGHAYLTDFGITKQVGGASTDTGRMVGTLDYLAPEQIRGEAVDGRTDCYALACVLYQCLSGAAPFRRETEAETLWAHMQDEPAPLRGHPALDPVLRKALAKDREQRFGTCGELIDSAAAALGLGHGPVVRPLVPPAIRRRGHLIAGAGLLLLAAAIAAAIVALTGGEESRAAPVENGVAAIDANSGAIASLTETGAPPSNIAVGEGAVWVLNTEEETVSQLDPESKRIVKTVRPRDVPTEVAAGAGALWVGTGSRGRGGDGGATVARRVLRIDPESGSVTKTVNLGASEGTPCCLGEGLPRLAVGAGGVWAIRPDERVVRIDPRTGEVVATIDVVARTIAAGDTGVWFLGIGRSDVHRIDPRTNRVAETITVGANYLSGLAAGRGSVWATAQEEGLVWRIDPGPTPVTRTIEVGVGVTFVAFGDGRVWTANFVDGLVSRIDPRTNSVTARVDAGAPQALAAGAGSAWVSAAGAAPDGMLPSSSCGAIVAGGREPDLLIASDLPLRGLNGVFSRAMADAIQYVISERGFKSGKYSVGFQSCDNSTAQTENAERRRCAANANAFARADKLAAVIGPVHSDCAQVQVPILNRAPDGPLALVSPSTTYPGLTRGGFALPGQRGYRGEPDIYYPTGQRNFMRLIARDDLQGVAHAMLAKRLGVDGVYLLFNQNGPWKAQLVDPFRRTGRRIGVKIAGEEAYDASKGFDALVERIARSGAQGVVLGGEMGDGGSDRLLVALRERLGPDVAIMTGDGFAYPRIQDVLDAVGPAARGLYVATAVVAPDATELSAAGRRFESDFGSAETPLEMVPGAAQAAEIVMDAIARSDGSRASVLAQLRRTRVKDGILGSFRFDSAGDMTPAPVMIVRVTGRTPPGEALFDYLQGAAVERVVRVPATLAR